MYVVMGEEATFEMIVREIKEGVEDTDNRPGALITEIAWKAGKIL